MAFAGSLGSRRRRLSGRSTGKTRPRLPGTALDGDGEREGERERASVRDGGRERERDGVRETEGERERERRRERGERGREAERGEEERLRWKTRHTDMTSCAPHTRQTHAARRHADVTKRSPLKALFTLC